MDSGYGIDEIDYRAARRARIEIGIAPRASIASLIKRHRHASSTACLTDGL